MKQKWIDIKKQLPPFYVPVLCVIKANCDCDHYSQFVFVRVEHKNDYEDYAWTDGEGKDLYHPHDILYWQPLPEMVEGLETAYDYPKHH